MVINKGKLDSFIDRKENWQWQLMHIYGYTINTVHKIKALTQPISNTNTIGSNQKTLWINLNHKH
jgi:hypothetical protein